LACLGSLACGPPAVSPTATPPANPVSARDAKQGEQLYDKYCKLCHAASGEGYAADNANALSNAEFLATADDGFLHVAIDRGRPGTPMAAYGKRRGGPLTSSAIDQIITYLRSLQTRPSIDVHARRVPGDAQAGEGVFRRECADCHGPRGQGTTAMSLNNPVFLGTASDGFIRYAIEHGRSGTPMPAFAGELSAADIDNVTRFVRGFTQSQPRDPSQGRPVGEVPPTFEQIVINPDGPAPSFPPLRDGRYLPAAAVKEALAAGARMVLLDARATSDWLLSHIPGAIPVPYYEPDKFMHAMPRDGTWIIAYCGCPHAASGRVMDTLRDNGFENTAVLDEGIFHWMAKDYPLTFGAER
jgi:cytochrome c oxidase cbb3-type subunit 3/ubiquinol-cytochrome c reductase cytochrome c subunit